MLSYSITIAPKAVKQINNLPMRIKTKVGGTIYNVIAVNPFVGKPLKAGLKGLYSYRMGDYRIIYSILKSKLIIQIIKVTHRKEAYR